MFLVRVPDANTARWLRYRLMADIHTSKAAERPIQNASVAQGECIAPVLAAWDIGYKQPARTYGGTRHVCDLGFVVSE